MLCTSSEGSAFSLAVLQAATQTHSCNSAAEAHFRAHAGLCGLTASRLGPCLLPLTEQACVARRSAASWSGASLPLQAVAVVDCVTKKTDEMKHNEGGRGNEGRGKRNSSQTTGQRAGGSARARSGLAASPGREQGAQGCDALFD